MNMMKLTAMVVTVLPAAVGLADCVRLDISGETARQTAIAEGGRADWRVTPREAKAVAGWMIETAQRPVDSNEVAVANPPRDMKLFLLIGQSNMAGRGTVSEEDRKAPPRCLKLNRDGVWVEATSPIHFDRRRAGYGIADTFVRRYLAEHPDDTVGLIPCAVGGSMSATWSPEDGASDPIGSNYRFALNRARLAQKNGRIAGILWHQGEADRKFVSEPTGRNRYVARLAALAAALRRELGCPDAPFLIGEIGTLPVDCTVMNPVLAAAADAIPNCMLVKASDLTGHLPDGVHFDTPSYKILGARYYEAWKTVSRTRAADAQEILRSVNDRLEREFVSHDGLLLDYVGEIPTAEEIADLKPNAMGWWSPIENGSMFTGEWLPALMAEGAARKSLVEKCVRGLIKMSEISDVPGFIARGTGTDGKSHHPLGSNDQTDPWFFGLCEYCRWPYADPALKAKALERLVFVAMALEKNCWGVPCDGPFKGENRGNLNAKAMPFWGKSRLLYSLKSLHRLTGDAHWSTVYESLKSEALDAIEAGGEMDKKAFSGCYGWGVWIYLSSVQALARLIEMEETPSDRTRMKKGLLHYAERVAPLMKDRAKYANTTERPFKYANWRTGYAWRVQKTQKDAEAVAHSGEREILGMRKDYERTGLSIPLSAAAICALSGEAKYRDEILATLRHYDYSTPNVGEFFHAAVAAAAIGAFLDAGEDVLVEDGVRAGDFGAPQVIVTEVAPERAHLAWPKIASDGGGNLVVGFVAAREHVEGNGVIGYAVSSDGGRSFSAPRYLADSQTDIWPHAANLALGFARGRYILLSMAYDGVRGNGVIGYYSDDGGHTWRISDTMQISSNRTGSVFGHIIDAGNGRLAAFGHRRPPAGPLGGIWMSVSDDRGDSWRTAQDVFPGNGLFEPDFVKTASGFIGLVRHDNADGYWQIRLDFDGRQTEKPRLVMGDGVSGHGFPSPCLVADPATPGRLLALRSRRFAHHGTALNGGEIDLWAASAETLRWRRLGTVVRFSGLADFGYPSLARLPDGSWLVVFYGGEKLTGRSEIFSVRIDRVDEL